MMYCAQTPELPHNTAAIRTFSIPLRVEPMFSPAMLSLMSPQHSMIVRPDTLTPALSHCTVRGHSEHLFG
ncbi:hypothetical protein CAP57_20015, partial [Enterobacter kobei]